MKNKLHCQFIERGLQSHILLRVWFNTIFNFRQSKYAYMFAIRAFNLYD